MMGCPPDVPTLEMCLFAVQPVEGRQERAERERLQAEILDSADVICCTLSFAGSGVFSRMARPLDALVVDEAAQTVEPACLIPMTLGMSQVPPEASPAIFSVAPSSTP